MKKMLGKVVRVLVTVKAEWGTLIDLIGKLASLDSESWSKNLKLFLRKEPCQWELEKPAEPKPVNTIIHVDRTVKPRYPNWMKEVLNPELEAQGPPTYDLLRVEQWLHDGQKEGGWRIGGHEIYHDLKTQGLLKACLTLRDGEEIMKNGIEAFLESFKGNGLLLIGSIVRGKNNNLYAPCLSADRDSVAMHWVALDLEWDGTGLVGRFPN